MSIQKERVLSSIVVNVETQTFDVKWEDRVTENDAVISRVPFRCSYQHRDQLPDEVASALYGEQ